MRLALLSDCYLPRLGGIEVQVHDLAHELVAAGHEVTVITVTPDPAVDTARSVSDGVDVHRLALPWALPGGLLVNPMAAPKVRRLLAEGGYDAAHVHMGVVSPFAMDCMRICLSLGVPTVVTWHSMQAHAVPAVRALGYVRRWARRGALLTAVSEVAAEPLRAMADAPVEVLPNGIDVSRWGAEPRVRHDDGSVRFVTAMRLALRKRPHHLLQLTAAAREASGTDVRLEILGDGPLRGRLERWIDEHDAREWISLPGRVSREELHERYLASDAYVAPAELEAFGIAALEARVSGLPVIGPRRSGITEFVQDGISGLLTDGDDDMVRAMAQLARDEELRARVRAHNVQTPISQDWPSVVETSVEMYTRAQRARTDAPS